MHICEGQVHFQAELRGANNHRWRELATGALCRRRTKGCRGDGVMPPWRAFLVLPLSESEFV
jgi:hypothetical protein